MNRLTRTDFTIRIVILIAIDFALYAFISDKIDTISRDDRIMYSGIFLVLYIVKVFQIIKRLHDTNLSGWYSIISFIPLVNIIFVLFLFFVEGTVGENKYGPDPKGRTKKEKNISQNSNNISAEKDLFSEEEINRKLNLIEDSYQNGLFTEEEYHSKKRNFESQKEQLIKRHQSKIAAQSNERKLRQLLDNGIISQAEFKSKLSQVNNSIDDLDYDISEIKPDSLLTYISRGKQYGPIKAEKIIRLLKSGEINPNCLVKHTNESTYNKRAKDLLTIRA